MDSAPLCYIDLHCDTAFELYGNQTRLSENPHMISLRGADVFRRYAQFFAVWSDFSLSDEQAWEQFFAISDYFNAQLQSDDAHGQIVPVRTYDDLLHAWEAGKKAAFLAVEDARILAGDVRRINLLADRGVRYLTLLWGGDTCIGGSHDTENGLSPFGKDVVHACFETGIIPDISHASERSAEEVLELASAAGKPVIATHSDAFSVNPHSRNLRDRHFRQIRALGGIVGLNLCRTHLYSGGDRIADGGDVLAHLSYFVNDLGGSETLAIGGDLDGTDLPIGYETVSDIPRLAEQMKRAGYADELIENIFWRNAMRFIKTNLN